MLNIIMLKLTQRFFFQIVRWVEMHYQKFAQNEKKMPNQNQLHDCLKYLQHQNINVTTFNLEKWFKKQPKMFIKKLLKHLT